MKLLHLLAEFVFLVTLSELTNTCVRFVVGLKICFQVNGIVRFSDIIFF
jgi:hypothetical protein